MNLPTVYGEVGVVVLGFGRRRGTGPWATRRAPLAQAGRAIIRGTYDHSNFVRRHFASSLVAWGPFFIYSNLVYHFSSHAVRDDRSFSISLSFSMCRTASSMHLHMLGLCYSMLIYLTKNLWTVSQLEQHRIEVAMTPKARLLVRSINLTSLGSLYIFCSMYVYKHT